MRRIKTASYSSCGDILAIENCPSLNRILPEEENLIPAFVTAIEQVSPKTPRSTLIKKNIHDFSDVTMAFTEISTDGF